MIGIMIVGLVLVIYAYRSLTLKRSLTGAAMSLKICGIAILSIALTEPLWSGVHVQPGTNLFAIAVDDSRSLQIKDSETNQPRLQTVQRLLTSSQPDAENKYPQWLIDLEQYFSVRKFSFYTPIGPSNAIIYAGERTFTKSHSRVEHFDRVPRHGDGAVCTQVPR